MASVALKTALHMQVDLLIHSPASLNSKFLVARAGFKKDEGQNFGPDGI